MTKSTTSANKTERVEQIPLPPLKEQAYGKLRGRFTAVVCMQMLLLGAFAAPQAYTLNTGKEITLKTVPVDPYDIFRGEYANLGYKDISQIDTTLNLHNGQVVYAILAKKANSNDWRLAFVATAPPQLSENQVMLKGKVSSYPWKGPNGRETVNVSYGIERLYMPEGKSLELQHNAKELSVDLAVGAGGEAAIKHVFMKEQRIYDGMTMLNPFAG